MEGVAEGVGEPERVKEGVGEPERVPDREGLPERVPDREGLPVRVEVRVGVGVLDTGAPKEGVAELEGEAEGEGSTRPCTKRGTAYWARVLTVESHSSVVIAPTLPDLTLVTAIMP